MRLFDRILLAAVRSRLTRRREDFGDGVAALVVAHIDAIKLPLQRRLTDFEHRTRQAENAAAETARHALAIQKFHEFEAKKHGLRLQ